MDIQTPLTEMLGITYPIIGAPMFLVSYEPLTIAVSEAGDIVIEMAASYKKACEKLQVTIEKR